MSQFDANTTSDEVCTAFSERIKGKTILITGCSPGGLGFETARALAHHQPKLLIVAGRSVQNMNSTKEAIRAEVPSATVRVLQLDLSTQKEVRKAASEFNSWDDVPVLDILINNAGVMQNRYELNEDGIEAHFATNHIGHFLFTNLIMQKILKAGNGARIVNLSSGGYRNSEVRFDDYNFSNGTAYENGLAYGQSKTANILFSVALADKLKEKGVCSYSVHPGVIDTNLARYLTMEYMIARGWADENGKWLISMKSPAQGAATTLVAALDPNIEDRSGAYLSDCNIVDTVLHYAMDKGNAEMLWSLSEELTRQKFDLAK